jgi:DnaJ-class molecular chaperone
MCIEESSTAETHRVRFLREMVKLSNRNRRRRKVPQAQKCGSCNGTGKDCKGKDCSSCAGTGTATDWR